MKSLKILAAIAIIVSFAFTNPKTGSRQINIVLDAGHGGKDSGATFNDLTEKEITAQIISKIQAQNKNENIAIHMTRISDVDMSLAARTALISQIKPDLVLSLHVNYNKNTNASGIEIYTPKAENAGNEKSSLYAEKLSDMLVKNHRFKMRGIKEAPFAILNTEEVPALVVELGFLSNTSDRAYLTNALQQDRIANTILEFITEVE